MAADTIDIRQARRAMAYLCGATGRVLERLERGDVSRLDAEDALLIAHGLLVVSAYLDAQIS